MKTRRLHNLTVSEVGMGCMAFSHGYGQIPSEQYSIESYDLSGKKLVPFNTHEGSGQSGTVSEIAASAPNAEMLEGIAIQGKVAQEDDSRTRELLTEWLGKLKLIN